MLNRVIESPHLVVDVIDEETVDMVKTEAIENGCEVTLWDDREDSTYVAIWHPKYQDWEVVYTANRYVY